MAPVSPHSHLEIQSPPIAKTRGDTPCQQRYQKMKQGKTGANGKHFSISCSFWPDNSLPISWQLQAPKNRPKQQGKTPRNLPETPRKTWLILCPDLAAYHRGKFKCFRRVNQVRQDWNSSSFVNILMKVLLNTESITGNETKISKFTRQWPFKAHLPWNTAERKVRIRAPTDQGSPPSLHIGESKNNFKRYVR